MKIVLILAIAVLGQIQFAEAALNGVGTSNFWTGGWNCEGKTASGTSFSCSGSVATRSYNQPNPIGDGCSCPGKVGVGHGIAAPGVPTPQKAEAISR